jgi:hypothetical protein
MHVMTQSFGWMCFIKGAVLVFFQDQQRMTPQTHPKDFNDWRIIARAIDDDHHH